MSQLKFIMILLTNLKNGNYLIKMVQLYGLIPELCIETDITGLDKQKFSA